MTMSINLNSENLIQEINSVFLYSYVAVGLEKLPTWKLR